MSLIPLNVCSVLGSAKIIQRTKVRNTDLEIVNVKEEDTGTFICTADRKREEQTLLVVSGELKTYK